MFGVQLLYLIYLWLTCACAAHLVALLIPLLLLLVYLVRLPTLLGGIDLTGIPHWLWLGNIFRKLEGFFSCSLLLWLLLFLFLGKRVRCDVHSDCLCVPLGRYFLLLSLRPLFAPDIGSETPELLVVVDVLEILVVFHFVRLVCR